MPRLGLLALLILWTCLGALRAMTWQHQPPHHIARLVAKEPTPVLLHGFVIDDPVELFSPNEPERQVAVIQTRHLRTDGGWRPTRGLLRARLRDPRLQLAYGDEILLEGNWSTVPGPGNPGQYDWRASLARQQIHALLAVEPYHGVVRLASGQGRWWFQAVYALRQRFEALIDSHFDEYHAGLLHSLLLGQRVALDEDLKRAFIETGTMHLLVISGFNVGLVAALLEVSFRVLGVPFRLRLLTSGVCLIGYWILTGMQPPVTRATMMAWIVLGALWLDRLIHWPTALATAALAILWWNPSQVFDPGFQLSFGAVLSLVVFTGRFTSFVDQRLRVKPGWLRAYLAISIASTLAIWIGLWPLLAWYFHLVSPVSILANLLLVPVVSLLVGFGTVVLLIGALMADLVSVVGRGLVGLVDLLVGLVRWCQSLSWGWWPVGHPPWLVIGGYYGLVAVGLLRRHLRLSPGHIMVCWVVGLNVWLWGRVGAQAAATRWLEVTVLDVGHGDSVVIRTPGQQTLVVDAGTQEAGRYVVVPFLRFKGFQTLDALFLTHPDEDHIGGVPALLQDLRIKRIFTNGFPAMTRTAHRVVEMIERTPLAHDRLAAGMRLSGDTDLEMDVLHPPEGFVPGTDPASNDNSLVLKLTIGTVSFLLCGDLEEEGIPWILRGDERLRATVMKVPHHGSALGAWGRRFIERVHPSTAIVSVGRLHGLPSPAVVQDLAEVGAQVFLTRRDGAVTIRTDGQRLVVTAFRHDKR